MFFHQEKENTLPSIMLCCWCRVGGEGGGVVRVVACSLQP